MNRAWLFIAVIATLSGCAGKTYHVPPGHILAPSENPAKTLKYLPVQGSTVVAKFVAAYDASYTDENEASKARLLTRYGMTLVDSRCDLFFEQIGRGAQTGDFVRREFQSITAALVAALGLSSVGNDAITGVGIGSALAIQSLDNYSNVYFFSPDVSAVQKLVRRTLLATRQDMLAPERSPKSYDDAINALRVYQNICTAHEIKRMVTEAIDPDRKPISRFGEESPLIYSDAANRALSGMAEAMGADNVDLRQAVLIEMLQVSPADWGADEKSYVCFTLAEKVRSAVCKSEPVNKGAKSPTIEKWNPKPTPFGPAVQPRIDAGLATLKALVPADYAAMQSAQKIAVKSTAPEYRKRLSALADADAAKADSKEKAAQVARLEEKLKQTSTPSIDAARDVLAPPQPADATATRATPVPPPNKDGGT